MSSVADNYTASNIAAATAAFRLKGGKYGVGAMATFGGGSVSLEFLQADGSTWTAVGTSTTFTAAGYAAVDLPPGQYRINVTTATAAYATVTGIPY